MNWKLYIKRTWPYWTIGIFSVLLITIVTLFFFRARILKIVVQEVITKVETKYPVKFTIQKAVFSNYNTVQLQNIALVPIDRDTLMKTSNINIEISPKSMLFLRPVFSQLTVENAYLTALKHNGLDNYSFLMKKKATTRRDNAKTRNYGELLNRLIETAFENVPDEVNFRNFRGTYQSDHRTITVAMPELIIQEGNIQTNLSIKTDSLVNTLRVNGLIDPDNYHISASLYTNDTAGIRLPYIQQKWDAKLSFDTLHVSLLDKRYKDDRLTIKGTARVNNLELNHPKIADADVRVNSSAINYIITLGENYYSLDSLSKVTVNKMVVYPQASLVTKPSKRIRLKVRSAKTEANDFIQSLPEGMFESFEGMKAQGFLTYKMNFFVDMARVDSLKFDSDLDAQYFNILQYGKTDFRKLNRSFDHTVYEYGKPLRTFTVGPENPNFTPYNQISPHIKNAILTSEDPRFFTHKGFHEGAFRHSIIENIKKNNFVRGGSTISMQLIKNVFLTRKKTIARKVEEILIVWLIENNRIASKQRMYEVYLNIIEWGPNVYGIKEASRFFFQKHPSQLNLAESLYLASIIPSPKLYRYSFDAYGNLRNRPRYYFKLISGIMRRRGLISEFDYETLYPAVTLRGRAHDLIVTATPPPDTTVVQRIPIDIDFDAPIDLLD